MNRFRLIAATGVCLLLAGCYNNPVTSLKKPGEGPVVITSGPAVGPGTTPGGSTAGPQPPHKPKAAEHGTQQGTQQGEAGHKTEKEAHGSPAEKH